LVDADRRRHLHDSADERSEPPAELGHGVEAHRLWFSRHVSQASPIHATSASLATAASSASTRARTSTDSRYSLTSRSAASSSSPQTSCAWSISSSSTAMGAALYLTA